MKTYQLHMNGTNRVFGYLNKHVKGRILIDLKYPKHSKYTTPEYDK